MLILCKFVDNSGRQIRELREGWKKVLAGPEMIFLFLSFFLSFFLSSSSTARNEL